MTASSMTASSAFDSSMTDAPATARMVERESPPASDDRRLIHNERTGLRLRVLQSGTETGGALLELEASWPARSPRPPVHLHPRQEERLTVQRGELTVEFTGARHVCRAGESIVIPAGVPHTVWNGGEQETVARMETSPALRTEQLFRALAELSRREPAPTPLEQGLLLGHFAEEIR